MKPKLLLLTVTALVLMSCSGPAAEEPDDSVPKSPETTAVEQPGTTAEDTSEHSAETEDGHEETSHEEAAVDEEEETHGHSDEMESSDHEVDRTIEVSMTDFAFEPSSIEVTSGETVEFVVANDGAVEHEFRLTSQHSVDDHMSNGHADHGENTDHDMMVLVPAGETDSFTATFADTGKIELYACLLPGHYEAGMEGELLIEG